MYMYTYIEMIGLTSSLKFQRVLGLIEVEKTKNHTDYVGSAPVDDDI